MIKKYPLLLILLPLLLACGKKPYGEYRIFIPDHPECASGGTGYLSFKVEIPEQYYFYANPKGPGTGKPVKVHPLPSAVFEYEPVRYLPAKKYYPPREKEFVWIYEHETWIFIPFSVKKGTPPGSYRAIIAIESLLCGPGSCIPKDFRIEGSVQVLPAGSRPPGDHGLQELFLQSSPNPETALGPGKTGPSGTLADFPEVLKPRYLSSGQVTGLIQAILFGLIAGIILNFMPCVLPVVSLKIMNFVKHAGEDRMELARLGFLFALGILTTFAALAVLAAYLGYNWGQLFQKRLFLIAMIAVIFALALSMFSVFTINIPSFASRASGEKANRSWDAYAKGILATLLATPCSGPFLGGTLAWALTQTPAVIFLIFMSVGAGMALPYILLTLVPSFMKYIPRPGEWTIIFEQAMAFLLVATVVYLITILGPGLILPTLWFLFILSLALWQYGRFGALYQAKTRRILSAILLLIMTAGGYYFSYEYLYGGDKEIVIADQKEYHAETLFRNRDAGRITIVKFTADWCPNCKLVESTSLNTTSVARALRDKRIDFLIADLTRENTEGGALMKKLGSYSIPFLAVFPPGSFTEPICLRDIYSEEDVLRAIEAAEK